MPPASPSTLTTARLRLRALGEGDADFLVALLNDPEFLRFIGDRRVRDRAQAIRYLHAGPLASYAVHGFGLCLVQRLQDDERLGICGLLRRDGLADVDLGFAFLPEHRGHGYALEAADAMLQYGLRQLQLPRVVAIVDPANERSIALLAKLCMRFEREMRLAPEEKLLHLYAIAL